MAEFPDAVRRRVLEKADFKCVLCRDRLAREVHHIQPPAEGGTHDDGNAAPLCAQCHEDHGNDPSYRRVIRHARDDWYQKVEQKYQPAAVQVIDKAYFSIVAAEDNPGDAARFGEAVGAVTDYYDTAIRGLARLRNAVVHARSVSDLSNGLAAITSATALGSAVDQVQPGLVIISGTERCHECHRADIPAGAAFCPWCRAALRTGS